jgi:hypothetical protein
MLSGPVSLSKLCQPQSAKDSIALLKLLKNELIGHEQKKEQCIKHGFVNPLVSILSACASNSTDSTFWSGDVTAAEREDLRLQATIILGSLAHGMANN